jgi:hypothetical protein
MSRNLGSHLGSGRRDSRVTRRRPRSLVCLLAVASLLALMLAATASASPSGERLWVRGYGGTCNGLAKAPGGCIYAVGAQGTSLILVKYSPSGARCWARTFNDGFRSVSGECVAVDARGDVVVAGVGWRGGERRDVVVLKYSAPGTRTWFRTSNDGQDEWPRALAVSNTGDVYVGATAYLLPRRDDLQAQIKLTKYGSAGDRAWSIDLKSADPSSYNRLEMPPNGLALDGNDDAYVAAGSLGTLEFSGETGALLASDPDSWARAIAIRDSTIAVSGALTHDPAVITYDPGLTRRYAVALSDPVPRAGFEDLVLDDQGAAYLAGLTDIPGQSLTVSLDAAGGVAWWQAPSAGPKLGGVKIAVDESGASYVAGTTYGSASNGGALCDFSLCKTDSLGTRLWLRTWGHRGRHDLRLCAMTLGRGSVYIGGYGFRSGKAVVIRYAR